MDCRKPLPFAAVFGPVCSALGVQSMYGLARFSARAGQQTEHRLTAVEVLPGVQWYKVRVKEGECPKQVDPECSSSFF